LESPCFILVNRPRQLAILLGLPALRIPFITVLRLISAVARHCHAARNESFACPAAGRRGVRGFAAIVTQGEEIYIVAPEK